jgi:hypothetical protein
VDVGRWRWPGQGCTCRPVKGWDAWVGSMACRRQHCSCSSLTPPAWLLLYSALRRGWWRRLCGGRDLCWRPAERCHSHLQPHHQELVAGRLPALWCGLQPGSREQLQLAASQLLLAEVVHVGPGMLGRSFWRLCRGSASGLGLAAARQASLAHHTNQCSTPCSSCRHRLRCHWIHCLHCWRARR